MAEQMHPLDAAEMRLRKAARGYRYCERLGVGGEKGVSESEFDGSLEELKSAASAYGEVRRIYVRPEMETTPESGRGEKR